MVSYGADAQISNVHTFYGQHQHTHTAPNFVNDNEITSIPVHLISLLSLPTI